MLSVATPKARTATTRDQKSLRISPLTSRIAIQAAIRLMAVMRSRLGQPSSDAMP